MRCSNEAANGKRSLFLICSTKAYYTVNRDNTRAKQRTGGSSGTVLRLCEDWPIERVYADTCSYLVNEKCRC